ncbi:MAG: GNAT family N-acetyltransferase, partial [Bacteroidia bacterium]
MTIREVLTTQDIREFHGVLDRVYEGDRDFIYPITGDVEAVFDVNKNKSFQNGAARRWLAVDSGGGG